MKLTSEKISSRQARKHAYNLWKQENPIEVNMKFSDEMIWYYILDENKNIIGSTCCGEFNDNTKIMQTVYILNKFRGKGYMFEIVKLINPCAIELGFYDPYSNEHKRNMSKLAEAGYKDCIDLGPSLSFSSRLVINKYFPIHKVPPGMFRYVYDTVKEIA